MLFGLKSTLRFGRHNELREPRTPVEQLTAPAVTFLSAHLERIASACRQTHRFNGAFSTLLFRPPLGLGEAGPGRPTDCGLQRSLEVTHPCFAKVTRVFGSIG